MLERTNHRLSGDSFAAGRRKILAELSSAEPGGGGPLSEADAGVSSWEVVTEQGSGS
jgi:hypothetical protein